MRLDLRVSGLDPLTRSMVNLPGDFARARRSALSSMGWWIRGELRNHIEYGGGGDWPGQHPMTQKFKKKYRTGNKWFGRRQWGHETPLFWLGKFARYRLSTENDAVQIAFGRSGYGVKGSKFPAGMFMDSGLTAIAERAEHGERIAVTEAMRRFFGATRRKRPKTQVPGQTYFPLKKSTTHIEIPKRPIFAPVWRKVAPLVPRRFADKFWRAVERYNKKR